MSNNIKLNISPELHIRNNIHSIPCKIDYDGNSNIEEFFHSGIRENEKGFFLK